MNLQITQDTINAYNEALKTPGTLKGLTPEIMKDISTTSGFQIYNLDVPAKLLVPFNTPVVNRIPRATSRGGTSTRWRAITAYAKPSGADPFIAESLTAGAAGLGSITTAEKLATYKPYGVGDRVSLEAKLSGKNFQDVKALGVLLTLMRLKVEEEKSILYANPGASAGGYAMAAPAAPTVTTASTGGSIAAITPTVFVAALGGQGVWDSGGIGLKPATYSAKHGALSSGTTGTAITGTGVIKATTTAVPGAFGYAWWVGSTATFAAATTKLEAITASPDVFLTAALGGTVLGNGAGITTTDDSTQSNAFAGIAAFANNSGSGAYISQAAADPTNFNGAGLSANGGGGIAEIDTANSTIFGTAQISPNLVILSGLDQNLVNNLAISSGATYIARVQVEGTNQITTGNRVSMIVNAITGTEQQLMVSPNAVPGSIFLLTETLPYVEANVNAVLEMDMLADYMEIDYYATQSTGPVDGFEVRCYGALKHYAPFTTGILQGYGYKKTSDTTVNP